jgi:Leucine Rich repeat
MSAPALRRRWYQLSLRTLLMVLTLAPLLGYVIFEREQCRRGGLALEVLDKNRRSWLPPGDPDAEGKKIQGVSSRPVWLKFILGDDQFRGVKSAELSGLLVSDSDLGQLAVLLNLREVDVDARNPTEEGVAHLRALRFVEKLTFSGDPTVRQPGEDRSYPNLWDVLAGWHHLRELSLYGLDFGEQDVRKLESLTTLKRLGIHGEGLTASGLNGIGSLATLEDLSLNFTDVSDEGLQPLAHLTNLRKIQLEKTKVVGPGLRHLAALPKLEYLDLFGCKTNDEGLASIARMGSLKTLCLDDAECTDAGLAHLSGLINLEDLNLCRAKISDAWLVHLRTHSNLKALNLHMTAVTGEGVNQLKQSIPKAKIRFFDRKSGD